MPTQHVSPGSDDLLQGVANALLKARKVVVVTGAGISTNSGIPDFRSENGLYSLIQAQFDAARQLPQEPSTQETESEDDRGEREDHEERDDDHDDGPPSKRRRISRESSTEPSDLPDIQDEIQVRTEPEPSTPVKKEAYEVDHDTIVVRSPPLRVVEEIQHDFIVVNTSYLTPRPQRVLSTAQPTTSPLSSPPPEDSIAPPSAFRSSGFRTRAQRRLGAIPLSSSPLSSPPPVLFDPFIPSSPSDASSDRRSSTSPSEVDEIPPSQTLFSSQASGKSLPNMKGKDLFDASIWSDPLRTSVFYTFATSLRQKIRDVKPTTSHRFISHLRDRGKLVRCYTQNIDQIEEKVGLSTSLTEGPGSRGRFSGRSTANTAQLAKMVESDGTETPDKCQLEPETSQLELSQPSQSQPDAPEADQKTAPKPQRSGVECVFLHGSLDLLRCFLCGRLCPWDELEIETLSGQQPECPHCVGATVAREEKGKRALGVGKLRPDIVLYGEEHPNAHLISPIVTHDLTLYPDMLLILGTSLRVHGLKVMVREFAKAVHSKGGSVVFVNFTKPPESSWGDIIDYWVEWDCDAWVQDLQDRIPKLWQAPEPPKAKKKRELSGSDGEKEKKQPVNPMAIRDTKFTGAYWTRKIMDDLHRITDAPVRRASISAPAADAAISAKPKPKPKRPRKSAPGALEQPKKASTLNPNHGRSRKQPATPTHPRDAKNAISSILNSVKENPRARRRKKIDGEEVTLPTVKRRSAAPAELTLPPLRAEPMSPFGRLEPMEPRGTPSGPMLSISPNMRSAKSFGQQNAFFYQNALRGLNPAPRPCRTRADGEGLRRAQSDKAAALVAPSQENPAKLQPKGIEQLQNWGTKWSC